MIKKNNPFNSDKKISKKYLLKNGSIIDVIKNKIIKEDLYIKNKVIENNSNVSIKNFIKVGVECEIYVNIAKDIIDQDQFSKEKIENLINYCGLSLEIVEDRFVEIKKIQ